ncbi:hypothetical protein D5S17_01750 [Pseudonocardiaceae bacterium YIM PH 21723]|nr:hypothetical protein D5S17_01750 [Pseudonocardiaceae bacterium YIM PH 21723]
MARKSSAIDPALLTLVRLLVWGSGLLTILHLLVAFRRLLPDNPLCPQTFDLATVSPLNAGVHQTGDHLCVAKASVGQVGLYAVSEVTPYAFAFVALVLFFRLLRTAATEGPFVELVPVRMRTLGYFAVLGGPVAWYVKLGAMWLLVKTMTSYYDHEWPGFGWSRWEERQPFPYLLLLVGLATVTFARVMRQGGEMRRDLEGTV